MAIVAAQIANGGKVIKPTVIKKEESNSAAPQSEKKQSGKNEKFIKDVSQQNLEIVREGMERVVNHNFGTAFQHRITESKYAMAGKTGTVQVRRRVEDNKNIVIPRKFRNHALFIGYAPIENPKFAISVVIEHGGSGSFAAGPVAKNVMQEAQRIFELKNKT